MKLTILQPTRHNGKRYAPGAVADIEQKAATALIDAGAAEPFNAKAALVFDEPLAAE